MQNPKYRFRLRDSKDPGVHNYGLSKPGAKRKLFNNLRHSEIDIVLETPDHLFIGEAKDESPFGSDPFDVLVHQLIREYVMASILVGIAGMNKKVVPFIVGSEDRIKSIKNTQQVKFMSDSPRCWLDKGNILSWEQVERLVQAT